MESQIDPGSPDAISAGEELASRSGTPDEFEHSVLCIEDDSENLALIERVFSHRPKLRLLLAGHGELGLDLARKHQPSLILLDNHLPDMSGEETLRRLGEDGRTRDIPVIVTSGEAAPDVIETMLAGGASAYLIKPLNVKQLLDLMDELVAKPQADRSTREARGARP
jgi:CheY-like chemotaxis protein